MSAIQGANASIKLKIDAKPVHLKHRPVPFKLLPLIDKELDFLVEKGLLQKIDTSEYATPIVPILKKNNRVRICGDFSVTVNPQIEVDEHPLPSIDELFSSTAGGVVFSKLDLEQAYLQMNLDKESSKILVLNTHRGLYRCKRLWYGVNSAPAIWQRFMENLLKDIEGVTVLLDDILIASKTKVDHMIILDKVFQKLNQFNVKINLEKCEFLQKQIKYCGFVIDKDGLHKDKDKFKAVENMPKPRNVSEVRSFIGMINYYARFIKNFSTILRPLNELLHKEKEFVWSKECDKSFQMAKKAFTSDTFVVHFDPKETLVLACDASPYGIGAVLSHRYADNTEKPIIFISHTLNKVQKKYAQIDKEA